MAIRNRPPQPQPKRDDKPAEPPQTTANPPQPQPQRPPQVEEYDGSGDPRVQFIDAYWDAVEEKFQHEPLGLQMTRFIRGEFDKYIDEQPSSDEGQ